MRTIIFLSAVFHGALAFPATTRVALEPEPARIPAAWKLAGPAQPEDPITLYFFLEHPSGAEAQLEAELMAVSDPRNPRYGKHLSFETLKERLFVPAHSATLSAWLAEHNVTDITPTAVGDMVQA
jgi:hypothetical protein